MEQVSKSGNLAGGDLKKPRKFATWVTIVIVALVITAIGIWLAIRPTDPGPEPDPDPGPEPDPDPGLSDLNNTEFYNAIIFDSLNKKWSQTHTNGTVVTGDDMQTKLNDIYEIMKHKDDASSGEFFLNRFALMFMPGKTMICHSTWVTTVWHRGWPRTQMIPCSTASSMSLQQIAGISLTTSIEPFITSVFNQFTTLTRCLVAHKQVPFGESSVQKIFS